MLKRSITQWGIFIVVVLTLSIAKTVEAQQLNRAQLLELRTKISDYKKNRDFETRGPIVDAVLSMGPKGAEEILKVLDREFLSLQKRYTTALARKAKIVHKKKIDKNHAKEIRDAQTVLASLRAKGKGLGKAEIVSKGDPALDKLKSLMLLATEDVIAEDEKLKKMRKDILLVVGYIDRCNALIPVENDKKVSSSKKKKGKIDLIPPQEKLPFLTYFERNEKVTIVMEILAQKKDVRVLKDNEKKTRSIDYRESLGILDLNIMRMLLGMQALGIDVKLCAAARDHSNDMRTKNFFAHESPIKGKKSPFDRARNFGTSANAENIAYGRASAESTNMQWFHSPGHHVNMLNAEYTVMGLGRSEKHWTQMFR